MRTILIFFTLLIGIFPVAALPPQEFSIRAALNGDNARITMPNSQTFGDSPVSALNLYFKTPYRGEYRFVVTKFATYTPALTGAREYFSISPEFKIQNNSNLEIKSPTPIDIYQLYSNGWHRLTVQVSGNVYKAQISSFGVFAIKDGSPLQVSVNQNRAQPSSWKERIEQKDYEIYNNRVVPFFNNLEAALQKLILVIK